MMSNSENQRNNSQSSQHGQLNNQQSDADVIDLGKLLGLLMDSKWLIISVTAIFAILGVAYALLATPIYKADALLQVETKSSGMSALVGDMGDMFSSESSATTEVEIIKSRMILGKTVDELNLMIQATPVYLPVVGKGLARLSGSQAAISISRFDVPEYKQEINLELTVDDASQGLFTLHDSEGDLLTKGKVGELVEKDGYRLFVQVLDAPEGSTFNITKRSKLQAIQWLQQALAVSERGKQTGILSLSFEGENKLQIEKILDSISQNYFIQNVERNSAEAEKSLVFLKKNIPILIPTLTI